ncbi:MAG TPA: CaiB/BaiF CoA-transferase family protein [Candidatus Sulfomarinibacteraceae bacterium]|nr:CaiB/BaiF CoA-transferase family protein [Candidatus Sulfomarinibacteraceae bacterium]
MTATPATAPGPLDGLRVVDCSTVLAGPYCTMLLADLGADVVKVEPPEGDATRGWGPPWVGDEDAGTRTAAYFLAVNRNKRSLRLDLRTEVGRGVLRRLIARGDVLVENFRAGGFERLGFSDPVLADINPALVHLAIGGYGIAGPDAAKPGYDFVIQAASGLMSITGPVDGPPTKVGVAISDVVAGLFGTVSVLAGLLARPRAGGQRVDVSLLQSTLAVLANQAQNAIVTGRSPGRRGNAHPNIVPYETFNSLDGEIAVAVGSERQWPRFCAALGLPELAADPRFATNGDRVAHRVELIPILAARLATGTSADWLARLDGAEVPAGPILDILDAFSTPGALAVGARVPMAHAALGRVDQVRSPFEFGATPATVRTPPPLLGEQADAVLAELGYDAGEIARLRADGIV